jgi:hypothetical protein
MDPVVGVTGVSKENYLSKLNKVLHPDFSLCLQSFSEKDTRGRRHKQIKETKGNSNITKIKGGKKRKAQIKKKERSKYERTQTQ